jgi:hypothetical protein
MARSIRFYRLLVLDVPETADEGHVQPVLPGGVRLMLDTEAVIGSFWPERTRATGNQPSRRSSVRARPRSTSSTPRVLDAGFRGAKEPWDAFWGQRYAQLLDPDGVPVDLYASL